MKLHLLPITLLISAGLLITSAGSALTEDSNENNTKATPSASVETAAPAGAAAKTPAVRAAASNAVKPIQKLRVKVAGSQEVLQPGDVLAPSITEVAALPNTGPARSAGPNISVNLVGSDINDVLKALTLQANANIITATDVQGEVTVSLQNVALEDALDSITKLSGYKWLRQGNTYYVASPQSIGQFAAVGSGQATTVQTVAFSRIKARDLQQMLKVEYPEVHVTIVGDPEKAREVILQGTTDDVSGAQNFIQKVVSSIESSSSDWSYQVYRVRYSSPASLSIALAHLVPEVKVDPGVVPDIIGGYTKVSGAAGGSGDSDKGGDKPTGEGDDPAAPSSPDDGSKKSKDQGTDDEWGVTYTGIMRTLILSGRPADIARAMTVLESIDIPSPQVMIEAKVVDVNLTDAKKQGFTFNQEGNGFLFGISANRGSRAIVTRGAEMFFDATVEALITEGKADVLAHPKVAVIDGETATIFIGDTIKYVSRIGASSGGDVTVETDEVMAGIQLTCMPHVNPLDGTISLKIRPEVSTPRLITDERARVTLPQVASRYVETTIRVGDGDTIVIGGLINKEEQNTLKRIPFLSDLPFLGNLFKHRDRTVTDRELMVFITSTIVKD